MNFTPCATTFWWLEITGRCQLECTHCYADSSPRGDHGTMTVQDWKQVIDQIAEHGAPMVQFIGGEPTLHPGLLELVEHALERGLVVEVFSNLVHVTTRMWETFGKPGVLLATSYYSDDPGEHAAITRHPSHARTKANIAKAVGLGIPVRAGVIDVGPGQRVRQARTELRGLGLSKIGYDRLRRIGRGGQQQATQLCGGCGDGVAAVDPHGDVRPCVFSRWVTPLGNVRTDTVADIVPRLPDARKSLVTAGMPLDSGPCKPQQDGSDCYPHND